MVKRGKANSRVFKLQHFKQMGDSRSVAKKKHSSSVLLKSYHQSISTGQDGLYSRLLGANWLITLKEHCLGMYLSTGFEPS